MGDVKQRLSNAQRVLSGEAPLGNQSLAEELAMLQLRKALESIAFGSLVANKDAYAATHADFATNYKLKNVLNRVAKQNAQFFPQPVRVLFLPNGQKHIEGIKGIADDSTLTREEMEFLHDRTGEVLHTWNPYKPDPLVVDVRRPLTEWIARTQRLLDTHCIALLDGGLWLVQMHTVPAGNVRAFELKPVD